jgi:hypothetical protein
VVCYGHERNRVNDTRLTDPAMQTPTPAQIKTAIELLKKYAERLNEQAAHSVIQMPESRLGTNYARRIQSQSIGQISHVEAVAVQLTNWLDEIIQPQKQ